LKKAIYKPTNQNTIILIQENGYCEILLNGEYKTVSSDILLEVYEQKLSSLAECLKNLLSDILYSYNTNRLTPEPHQYKPLIKFLNSENSRVLIADEVGLWKSIEFGMIFKKTYQRKRK